MLLAGCASKPALPPNEFLTGGTLWLQGSGEAKALRYQAFTLARFVLDRDKKKGLTPEEKAKLRTDALKANAFR